jgi:branched-chain amino acid aminotransferase
MSELIYLDGSLVPRSQAHVSVFDHGFLYGYGLFETMRAYRGGIFRLERHMARLMGSAQTIGLGSRLAGLDLGRACLETLRANRLTDARLRLTVTGGEADSFPWEGKAGAPTVVITARRYVPPPAEKYRRGYQVVIASVRRSRSRLSGVKSLNYLVSVMARMEAAASGRDEALLLNDGGFIAEGGNSNVFFVKGSCLVTPSLESGILPGITREVVMELAAALGIRVTEGEVAPAELVQFDEAFLTSSTMEIMPLVVVRDEAGKGIIIGTGRPGDIAKKLMKAYKGLVARETA